MFVQRRSLKPLVKTVGFFLLVALLVFSVLYFEPEEQHTCSVEFRIKKISQYQPENFLSSASEGAIIVPDYEHSPKNNNLPDGIESIFVSNEHPFYFRMKSYYKEGRTFRVLAKIKKMRAGHWTMVWFTLEVDD